MKGVDEAVILAGGKGTRLRSVTMNEYPKALTLIQDRSILEWEIEWLAREGVTKVIIAIGYLGQQIEEYLGASYETRFGVVEIEYSHEDKKLGSGGAVKLAGEYVTSEQFFVLNGDVLCDVDLDPLIKLHEELNVRATMLTVQMQSPYGNVEIEDNIITKFVEKPLLPVFIHGGLDLLEQSTLDEFPDVGQMEDTIFVKLAESRNFAAYSPNYPYFWQSIDTEKDYSTCNETWPGL